MSAIAVDGVSRVFLGAGGVPTLALAEIDLRIEDGEFVVLLGPSGCGKTTLLRIMGRLDTPTAGRVDLEGERAPEAGSEIGFVFQEATLMPWRSALANVELPLELTGMPSARRRERANQMLELVGLGAAAQKSPNQLSGGMRQRVSIARALAHDPRVLLMDEPFGALDAQTRDAMNLELQRIWLQQRTTIVFVTHAVSEAVFLADRVVMLGVNPGRVHTITEIPLPRPRNVEMIESADFRRLAGDLRRQLSEVHDADPAREVGVRTWAGSSRT